mgnify:CR=1 FL=1
MKKKIKKFSKIFLNKAFFPILRDNAIHFLYALISSSNSSPFNRNFNYTNNLIGSINVINKSNIIYERDLSILSLNLDRILLHYIKNTR